MFPRVSRYKRTDLKEVDDTHYTVQMAMVDLPLYVSCWASPSTRKIVPFDSVI